MLQTVDAAVIQQWEEATADAVSAAVTTAACGLSFSLSSAADAAADMTEADAAVAMTAACGSSFFLSSAADVVSAADADATANHVLNLRNNKDGVNHSVLLIAFLYSSI